MVKKKHLLQSAFSRFLKRLSQWFLVALGICLFLVIGTVMIFQIAAFFRETKTPSEIAPQEGRFITTRKGKMFIEERGSRGPTVLFIHGFGAWSQTWQYPMDELARQGFHTIALDMPPFGFSTRPLDRSYGRHDQAERILAAIDALHVQRVVLVGHSFGGGPTMEAAFLAPDKVSGLVLVDAALGLGEQKKENQSVLMTSFFVIKPLRNAVIATTVTNPFFTKKLLQSFIADPSTATDARVAVYQQPLVLKNSTNDLADWMQFGLFRIEDTALSNNEENYKRLRIPTFLIWGEKDTVTPPSQARYIQSLIPTSQLVYLKNVGHIPQIENEKDFTNVLVDFLLLHTSQL